MIRTAVTLLEKTATVYAAAAVSLALGLFFIFVWSPLPWGWKGIDMYDEIALSLARGEPFPTMHLVWGYAYFLAFWYWLFGNHPWVPLIVQALLNASIPLMVYRLVRLHLSDLSGSKGSDDQPVAVLAAVLSGLLSFNTVYAATQASDSMCTVLVVATTLALTIADRNGSFFWFAAAGLLAGLAYQFRPNLILFPLFVGACYLLARPRSRTKLVRIAIFLAVVVLTGLPWVIRNYRWSGLFVPASTHGGVQLWFGTLQAGEYEDSWIYNPRASFENPPVDYTSVDEFPIVITANRGNCELTAGAPIDLVYWTNRDRTPMHMRRRLDSRGALSFEVPTQPSPTALYYYFEEPPDGSPAPRPAPATASASGGEGEPHDRVSARRTPREGPLMLVISRDHLGNLDVDNFALDIVDIVRMVQAAYFSVPVADASKVDLDSDGVVTDRDIRLAADLLIHDRAAPSEVADEVSRIDRGPLSVTLELTDGSAVVVPKQWSGKITDLPLRTVGVGSMAALLVSRSRPFRDIGAAESERGRVANQVRSNDRGQDGCVLLTDVAANRVPYRRLPHELRRFTALALDNIRLDPVAFAKASLDRAVRVFVVAGSPDTRTAYQFTGARLTYQIGRAVSLIYLGLFLIGVGIALVTRRRVLFLLTPIVYVPLTICFLLINARYSMTAQPFMFAFVALALDRLAGLVPQNRERFKITQM